MLRGQSLSIYERFSGKKRTSNTAQRSFFPITIFFLGKRKEKLARKARVNTDASISDLAHAPWTSHNTP